MEPTAHSVIQAAAELDATLTRMGYPYCLIGGIAVQRWGEPRMTQDADATVLTDIVHDEPVVDQLLEHFQPRDNDARDFALARRVLLLYASNQVPIDISLGATKFEKNCIERSSAWHYSETVTLNTCSAEDLVTHKVFAGREQDWLDVCTILIRKNHALNLKLIRKELSPLLELKEDSEALPRLE
ncbi:MAG: hypothetical protein AAF649_13370, partial [Verrucomicrobiota bacterium]